jgi:hypothetical protein
MGKYTASKSRGIQTCLEEQTEVDSQIDRGMGITQTEGRKMQFGI